MAQPKWLEKYLTMKPEVAQIFEDLEQFREFCADYGHVFNEGNLYNWKAPAFVDFMRKREGKFIRNQWDRRDGDRERRNFKPREGGQGGYRGNNYRSNYRNA